MLQHLEITDAQAVRLAGVVIARLTQSGVVQRKKGDRTPVIPKFHSHSSLILNVDNADGRLHFQTPLMEEPFVSGSITTDGTVEWDRRA